MACVKRGLCVRSVVAGAWDKGLEVTKYTQGKPFSELNGRMKKTRLQRQTGSIPGFAWRQIELPISTREIEEALSLYGDLGCAGHRLEA